VNKTIKKEEFNPNTVFTIQLECLNSFTHQAVI